MKLTLTILLFLGSLALIGQTDPTDYPFIVYWKTGVEYNFGITKIKDEL